MDQMESSAFSFFEPVTILNINRNTIYILLNYVCHLLRLDGLEPLETFSLYL